MTIRAMQTAATGMSAYEYNLDTIANNLANTGTTAFKTIRTDFEDQFYEYFQLPGTQDGNGRRSPVGVYNGTGVKVSGSQADFKQGPIRTTGRQLDLTIEGPGFFQIQDGSQTLYTRNGTFTVNANGEVVLASADKGRLLVPNISVPIDAIEITISSDGIVEVKQPGTTTTTQVGQIQLARFINNQGLIQRGDSLFSESNASGTPQISTPGLQGVGTVKQGALEASNVDAVNELVGLIKTQRYFELSSQAVQAADQMLQLIVNLRRF